MILVKSYGYIFFSHFRSVSQCILLFIYLLLVKLCLLKQQETFYCRLLFRLCYFFSMTFDKLGFKNRKLSEATDSNSLETTSNYTDQADESTQDVESTKIQGRQ